LVFKNKVWLAEGLSNIGLYTDSVEVSAQTSNPGSLQEIRVGQDLLKIPKTYERFTMIDHVLGNAIKTVNVPTGDIMIVGDGMFAFDSAAFFNPTFKQVDQNFIVGDTKYILANYSLPKKTDDGWQTKTIELDLTNAYREDNKNQFIISIPGLRSDDIEADYIAIKDIKADLLGRSLQTWLQAKFAQVRHQFK
jgi:hypothetical protein